MWSRSLLAAVLLGASIAGAQELPAGTVIPVMVTVTLDSARAQAGQPITGKIMERVPLPGGKDIPEGAKIVGHVSLVIPAQAKAPENPLWWSRICSHIGYERSWSPCLLPKLLPPSI